MLSRVKNEENHGRIFCIRESRLYLLIYEQRNYMELGSEVFHGDSGTGIRLQQRHATIYV